MKLTIAIYIFLFLYSFCVCGKVSDRWSMYPHDKNARCLVAFPSQSRSYPFPDWKLYKYFPRATVNTVKRFNCTFKNVAFTETGQVNATGHYNGFIGILQRDEADFAPLYVRPDSLPFEPVKLTPAIMAADVIILTHRNESKWVDREIIHFVKTVPMSFYIYSSASMFFIFACLYSFVECLRENVTVDSTNFIEYYKKTYYSTFRFVLHQDKFDANGPTCRTLFLSLAIFIFLIANYYVSQIGTDLKAKLPPEQIDSLEDLLEKPSISPLILKNLFLYELIKASPKDSILSKLWERINENLDVSIVHNDATDLQGCMKIADKALGLVDTSKAALLIPGSVWNAFVASICIFAPEKNRMLRISDEFFAGGILTTGLSKNIHPSIYARVHYHLTTINEIAMLQGYIQNTPSFLGFANGFEPSYKNYKCLDSRIPFDPPHYQAFSLSTMTSLFYFWSITLTMATVVLIIERFLVKLTNVTIKIKQQKGQTNQYNLKSRRSFKVSCLLKKSKN